MLPLCERTCQRSVIALSAVFELHPGRLQRDAFTFVPTPAQPSLQLILDLIEAGLHAGLVLLAAGRTGDSCCAGNVIADLNWQSASRGGEASEKLRAHLGIVLQAFFHFPRRNLESARGKRLLERIFHGMGPRTVATYLNNDLADATHNHGRNLEALRLAISHGGRGDGNGDIGRDVLVNERLS